MSNNCPVTYEYTVYLLYMSIQYIYLLCYYPVEVVQFNTIYNYIYNTVSSIIIMYMYTVTRIIIAIIIIHYYYSLLLLLCVY